MESSIAAADDFAIDLLDVLFALLNSKRIIALTGLIFAVVGVVIALVIPPYYTATAVIMTPQQDQSSTSALIGQLGVLGGLGGAASGLGLKNPADMYVGILGSRGIADHLVDQFHLKSVYKQKLLVDARRILWKHSEFEAAKDGLIYIRVKSSDPRLATNLANGYVAELYSTNSRLAIGQAAQRRLFYDEQLQNEKALLSKAEDDLKQTEETTGLVQLSGQAEMTIRNIATTRAQISSLEVERDAARTYVTDENPSVVMLDKEIATLKDQLTTLERAAQSQQPGDIQVPAGSVPKVALEYMRKLREVRYHESLYELLSKQAEAAYLDEAKAAPLIQEVDSAEIPEKKSGPSRTLITAGFALLGLFLGATWAILQYVVTEMKQHPRLNARLQRLKEAMSFRRTAPQLPRSNN